MAGVVPPSEPRETSGTSEASGEARFCQKPPEWSELHGKFICSFCLVEFVPFEQLASERERVKAYREGWINSLHDYDKMQNDYDAGRSFYEHAVDLHMKKLLSEPLEGTGIKGERE